ncbi:putative bifunctional diguanylate cyclase/phosphodiesterase [Bacillus coahuilensis]|uniref:putative bifunctional diguanylate cyclase/phosphodiesterase n=2 Tax=Bacillus coahuilensis TaxID=408580 RepID=UPI0007504722|nr:bifunctional diguanylate cyclase/phosphodiesterase [Bacillus coahuilensis]
MEVSYLIWALLLNMLIIYLYIELPRFTKNTYTVYTFHTITTVVSLWVTSFLVLFTFNQNMKMPVLGFLLFVMLICSLICYGAVNYALIRLIKKDVPSIDMFIISLFFSLITAMLPIGFLVSSLKITNWDSVQLSKGLIFLNLTFFLIFRIFKQIRIDERLNNKQIPMFFKLLFSIIASISITSGVAILYEGLKVFSLVDGITIINLIALSCLILITILYSEKQYNEKHEELKEHSTQLEFLAQHDQLTLLPNRLYLESILTQHIEKKEPFYLLFLDLDSFKHVNDYYGHSFGDELLKQVSKSLQELFTLDGFVSRMGGDEFIILYYSNNREEVRAKLDILIETLTIPTTIHDHHFSVTTSIGVSHFPSNTTNSDKLIIQADLAMYHSKDKGKNQYSFFTEHLLAESDEKLEIQRDLRSAMKHNHFTVFYQPLYDLSDEKIINFEALLRWNHPEKGYISPSKFIPIAEETGIILELGEWVLKQSIKQMIEWHRIYNPTLKLSVNVSMKQIEHPAFLSFLSQTLQEFSYPPHLLILEVTETLAMKNIERALNVVRNIQDMGVNVSIDDFGTGHSSLSYLQLLGIKHIKIDRSFIDGIVENSKSKEIVKAILSIAQHLQLNVTAEGIETKEQLHLLKGLNCQSGQGFLLSKPIPPEKIEKLLEN